MTCATCFPASHPAPSFARIAVRPRPQVTQVARTRSPFPKRQTPRGHARRRPVLKVEGQLVPVVDVELGTQQTVVLRAPHPALEASQRNAGVYEPARAPRSVSSPGCKSSSRRRAGPATSRSRVRLPGQIVALRLSPGQSVDVREHQFLLATSNVGYSFFWQQGSPMFSFRAPGCSSIVSRDSRVRASYCSTATGTFLRRHWGPAKQLDVEPGAWLWKDSNVRMDTVSVLQSGGGGGLLGAIGAFIGGSALSLNRFTGPGRIGLQSMTYHEPQAEGAQQTGGTANIGGVINSSSAISSRPA